MFVSGFLLVTAMLLALAVCLVRMRIVERELELAHRVLAKANLATAWDPDALGANRVRGAV